MVCTLIENDTHRRSGQNVADSQGPAEQVHNKFFSHWHEQSCLDPYQQWQISQSDCKISSNWGKKWIFPFQNHKKPKLWYIVGRKKSNQASMLIVQNPCTWHAIQCEMSRPNRLASRPKLKTSVYLRLRLARPCVHLRWLATTCAHFGRYPIFPSNWRRFSTFWLFVVIEAY